VCEAKQAFNLTEVCADLQLKGPTVLRALSERASISAKTLEIALMMRENGKTLHDISDLCEVPMTLLIKILPGEVSRKKSSNSQTQVSHSINVKSDSKAEAAVVSSTKARHELPGKKSSLFSQHHS
jgi:lambda repressor-like predicted transcriptional regulator